MTMTGKVEEQRLGLASLLATKCFIDTGTNGVVGFRRRRVFQIGRHVVPLFRDIGFGQQDFGLFHEGVPLIQVIVKAGSLKDFATLNHDASHSLPHSVPPLQQPRLEKPEPPPSYSQQSLMERESCRIRNTNTSAVKKPRPGWHWPTKYCPGS